MSDEKQLIIVKKYARAFVNLFLDKLDIEQINILQKVISFLNEHKKIIFYVELSAVDNKTKKKVLKELFGYFNLDEVFVNLVKLLIENRRLFLLPSILFYIVKIYKNLNNIMDFTIISSHELTDEELKTVISFLEHCTGKQINYKLKIDKSLIAGLKIFSETLGWEYSIDRQLKLMEQKV